MISEPAADGRRYDWNGTKTNEKKLWKAQKQSTLLLLKLLVSVGWVRHQTCCINGTKCNKRKLTNGCIMFLALFLYYLWATAYGGCSHDDHYEYLHCFYIPILHRWGSPEALPMLNLHCASSPPSSNEHQRLVNRNQNGNYVWY